jgi:thymidylate synthase (FAD)
MTLDALVTEQELIPPGAKEVLPPYGFVRLLATDASDLAVVNAARVSFNKESEWDMGGYDNVVVSHANGYVETRGTLFENDEKVLKFLLKNRHGTPFEHTYFKFHVRAPIFVFREWHRHRIGISINEESARYVPLQPHYYVPMGDALRRQTDKPGRYKFEPITDAWLEQTHGVNDLGGALMDIEKVTRVYEDQYRSAHAAYEQLMAFGIAKEVARTVLPVGIYSQMIWTCNARSLMNFCALRNADTALREIRLFAEAMEDIARELMPVTFQTFVENGRVAP